MKCLVQYIINAQQVYTVHIIINTKVILQISGSVGVVRKAIANHNTLLGGVFSYGWLDQWFQGS